MNWEYSDNEFVKMYRKLLKWEWYTDVNTKVLFLHCLLKANWKDGSWHGYKYKRGQFITSLNALSRETGLTVKQVRTALNHLIRTGEVASKNYPKFRVITVISYDEYQQTGKQTGKQGAGKGQATGKQGATDIRTIRSIEDKKPPKSPIEDEAGEPWEEGYWD